MKKAALVTFCNNFGKTNYGQVLQCYALYKKLTDLHLNVKVIPYRAKGNRDIIKEKLPFGWMNSLYENWFQENVIDVDFRERVNKFQGFIRKSVKITHPCYSINDVEKVTSDCDMLICGSDQIWNPRALNRFYELDFGKESQKRFSYASSGIVKENTTIVNKYKELGRCLDKFDYISVRERAGAEILKKYTSKNVEDVLDPTFLLSSKEWDEVSMERIINKTYIFCYNLGGIRPYKMILRKLKDYYNAEKIVYIKSNLVPSEFPGDFIEISNAGPKEFLSLIKYSNAVCTDSFHGMAFSVNYNKQFCLLRNLNTSIFYYPDRTSNILEKFNIKNEKISSLKDIENINNIDYSEVNKLLELERKRSLDFLKKAVSEE